MLQATPTSALFHVTLPKRWSETSTYASNENRVEIGMQSDQLQFLDIIASNLLHLCAKSLEGSASEGAASAIENLVACIQSTVHYLRFRMPSSAAGKNIIHECTQLLMNCACRLHEYAHARNTKRLIELSDDLQTKVKTAFPDFEIAASPKSRMHDILLYEQHRLKEITLPATSKTTKTKTAPKLSTPPPKSNSLGLDFSAQRDSPRSKSSPLKNPKSQLNDSSSIAPPVPQRSNSMPHHPYREKGSRPIRSTVVPPYSDASRKSGCHIPTRSDAPVVPVNKLTKSTSLRTDPYQPNEPLHSTQPHSGRSTSEPHRSRREGSTSADLREGYSPLFTQQGCASPQILESARESKRVSADISTKGQVPGAWTVKERRGSVRATPGTASRAHTAGLEPTPEEMTPPSTKGDILVGATKPPGRPPRSKKRLAASLAKPLPSLPEGDAAAETPQTQQHLLPSPAIDTTSLAGTTMTRSPSSRRKPPPALSEADLTEIERFESTPPAQSNLLHVPSPFLHPRTVHQHFVHPPPPPVSENSPHFQIAVWPPGASAPLNSPPSPGGHGTDFYRIEPRKRSRRQPPRYSICGMKRKAKKFVARALVKVRSRFRDRRRAPSSYFECASAPGTPMTYTNRSWA
ncbi:hypothetical protein BOTBODRAFT_189479 [Botryobasidium botryosum FD-172 SS1]|uniref:Uncharacterized protein n=1 Tax=Botryobasidium botryosum (strain FD-172 SS1) TaxID=930990 RepID=A0A067MBA6_BOTB1|nr:hypothetical protein BOTBODRAFT_189479 [Botryobasidium botryosum FD-172 SS1]